MDEPLLVLDDLTVRIPYRGGMVTPVRGVSLEVRKGEVLGLVGESGCGKSTTGLSVMRLLPASAGISGRILWQGENLLGFDQQRMRSLRGNRIAMVFQNPLTSLNPTETVGFQIEEAMRVHQPGLPRAARRERAEELLNLVGIPDPRQRLKSFPHECSGGMRQRIVIAIALANNPDLLIADEPTTALDVSIQAQILWLLEDLQQRTGMAMIYITHDLDVASSLCHRIAVMYAGQAVEQGDADVIFGDPAHPYTKGLMGARPRSSWRDARVRGIPGQAASLAGDPGHGCPFAHRCPVVTERCRTDAPQPVSLADGHEVRCFAL